MTTPRVGSIAPPVSADSASADSVAADLRQRYLDIRGTTRALAAPLAVEDQVVQSMPDTSPTKWHLAHTSWFFETFVMEAQPGYSVFHPQYRMLFNSYYNAVGPFFYRPERGLLSRPTVAEILEYREHVDGHVMDLLAGSDVSDRLRNVVELGLHHEQQHQELLLTDVQHLLSLSPLHPVYRESGSVPEAPVGKLGWASFPEAIREIGFGGDGFSYDNETPRHRMLVGAFSLADRLVTNAEYLAFMEDGGYERADLWLSDGWTAVQGQRWEAPLYWERVENRWHRFSLRGFRRVCGAQPVCHVSYFEADAYARWAGARLPTEAEWETAASAASRGSEGPAGHFLEDGHLEPWPLHGPSREAPAQLLGDVWEWTQSPYAPYPGYRPLEGALGEYNGKFMVNQLVLRGGSCATPRSHIRPTYRNFFRPDARWQFMGFRLARDA